MLCKGMGPHKNKKPYTISKGRKEEKGRGRRRSKGFKVLYPSPSSCSAFSLTSFACTGLNTLGFISCWEALCCCWSDTGFSSAAATVLAAQVDSHSVRAFETRRESGKLLANDGLTSAWTARLAASGEGPLRC